MRSEIEEQPDRWQVLLEDGLPQLRVIADVIRAAAPRVVLLLGRGTSANAARYAQYLVAIDTGIPVGLLAPSTVTVYDREPSYGGALVIAVSQSGGSPDLVSTLKAARRGGALTVALTNDPGSELARVAQWRLDMLAGPEYAVAASKSYTCELLSLYLLLRLAHNLDISPAWDLPGLGRSALGQHDAVAALAYRLRDARKLVLTGRGYAYPTAREAALKLMETSYLSAQAFSGADLLHGPLAALDGETAVIAIRQAGRGGAAMDEVIERVRQTGAQISCLGAEGQAGCDLTIPKGVTAELSPLVEILPLQQLALAMAIDRGLDPDRPRNLKKITQTW